MEMIKDRLNIQMSSLLLAALAVVILGACSPAEGNDPGHEYMPDMFHSTAYEANLYDYYYYNTWGSEDEYYAYALPRKPVKGTIPRGFSGMNKDNAEHFQGMPVNGFVPYYYEDTEEERLRATAEITTNPVPYTQAAATKGKELYDIFCGICHGEKGDGGGYLVRDDGGVYPAQPANFLLEEFLNASEGRYYHSIMYGKNVMGAYADKLSYEERWQVIHHIRSLQATELGTTYPVVSADEIAMVEEQMMMEDQEDEVESDSHGDGSH